MLQRITRTLTQNPMINRHEKLVNRVLLLLTVIFAFTAGLLMGVNLIYESATRDSECLANPKSEVYSYCTALRMIHQSYVNQPVDDKILVDASIRAMTASLNDKYSMYLSPTEYQDFEASLSGEYTGIGFYGKNVDGRLVVANVFKDSPAEKSGLKVGDRIYSIDGVAYKSMDYETITQKIAGPVGTTVTLEVERDGAKIPLSVVREKIQAPSVSYKELSGGIAYVNITVFGEHTLDELQSALSSADLPAKAGLIIDLRDDGGGRLVTLKELASLFLPKGTPYMVRVGSNGEETILRTDKDGVYQKTPIVVLVNENTASAAEAFTAAMHDSRRGVVIGNKTYGKGTVQSVVELPNNGGLRVTISRWLTPERVAINGIGVTPDIVVASGADNQRDAQLDKAVETITK